MRSNYNDVNIDVKPLIDEINFFSEYQRFDDGDFKTPKEFPYMRNTSCYGNHTCYYGVIKLLKGLSHIPGDKRNKKASDLIDKCVNYILLHQVCYSSHSSDKYLAKNIDKISFPNMYKSDFLEILWLLKRENIKSIQLERSLKLLESKMKEDETWELERVIKDLITPVTKTCYGNLLVTKRAREVAKYYGLIF